MKKKSLHFLTLCLWLASQADVNAAPPTSGAYVDDPVNTYVQDEALESIEQVNMILCVVGSFRAEQKVGAGNYNALVDAAKCEGKGESGNAASAGASAASDYLKVVVNSTRASNTAPLVAKAWINTIEGGEAATIYTNTNVTKGASETAPNGNMTMDFVGYPNASPTNSVFRGRLAVTDSAITLAQTDKADGDFTLRLTVNQSGLTNGSGRVSQTLTGSSQGLNFDQDDTYDVGFAYNSTHFYRQRGSDLPRCFTRDKSQADYSVWRYGVYKSDGSRLALTNPGFPVTYTAGSQTYWGYASFHGIYLPDTALTLMGSSATVKSQDGGTTYNYSRVGGKLTKLSKGQTTLNDIKGLKIGWVWLNESVGGQGATYHLEWNGTHLVKTEKQKSDGDFESANNDVVLVANQRDLFQQNTIYGYSEALGGQIFFEIPASGFSGSQVVNFSTRSTVSAADAANLTLICVSECLDTTNGMSAALPVSEPYVDVGIKKRNRSGVLASSAKLYKFSNGMMYLNATNAGNQVDASSALIFTTSGNNPKLKDGNQWGLRTGLLVAAIDGSGSAPDSVLCDNSGGQSGQRDHICPHLFQSLTDTYEWETGPNSWNQNATLTQSGSNSEVVFDPPKRLKVTLSTSNSTAASSQIGSSLQLDYQGFGDLWGIPGGCYNPKDNSKGPCDSTTYTSWAPEFMLKAGAEVTETVSGVTQTYYVKPIDQEMRFALASDPNACNNLSLPTNAALPSLPTGDDAKTIIGPQPTVTGPPVVIHGVLQ
jgi:hypothetical protein